MKKIILAFGAVLAATTGFFAAEKSDEKFTDSFDVDKSDLASTGTNRFFILAPGFQLVLEGKEEGEPVSLTIRVLKETKMVDGVETRVVEEKETVGGELTEISRNFFAISKQTTDVFYFGEEVDIYEKGKVVAHEGAWMSGAAGARFGLLMPGTPLLGAKHYQELAPKTAMDRAEVISLKATIQTPAGAFGRCLETEETSALEKGKERKLYAPGIGLVAEGNLRLTKFGYSSP
jgi:hypothetical protein